MTELPAPQVTRAEVPDKRLGYVGHLVVRDAEVFAVGGTYHSPTLLHSTDHGVTFSAWATPRTSGLRDLCLDGARTWVVGEYGCIAHTKDAGTAWKRVKTESNACLYAIERDAKGLFWITGDDGLVLRSLTKGGRTFERVPTRTAGRVLALYFDPKDANPWLLDSTGALQRWNGKKFVVVEIAALRTKHSLNRIVRTPSGALIVTANGGAVLRSSNDGASWKKIATHVRTELETVVVTRYGIFVAGDNGTLLVSYDDGRTFTVIESLRGAGLRGHLWTIANVKDAILIGGDNGDIFRIPAPELAKLMHAATTGKDEVLAALALRIIDGDEGAEMVLEDALRERMLWDVN
jgi:photosystem II stability/assembly factor-like uncharacterized protein